MPRTLPKNTQTFNIAVDLKLSANVPIEADSFQQAAEIASTLKFDDCLNTTGHDVVDYDTPTITGIWKA